jgi:predicted GIY-YIG superfamily endonuclease
MYTGITNNLVKRLKAHVSKSKSAAKFTKSFKPEKLIACWRIDGGRGQALKVENYIKKMNRVQKEDYAQNLPLLSLDCEKDLSIKSVPFSENDIEQVNVSLFS